MAPKKSKSTTGALACAALVCLAVAYHRRAASSPSTVPQSPFQDPARGLPGRASTVAVAEHGLPLATSAHVATEHAPPGSTRPAGLHQAYKGHVADGPATRPGTALGRRAAHMHTDATWASVQLFGRPLAAIRNATQLLLGPNSGTHTERTTGGMHAGATVTRGVTIIHTTSRTACIAPGQVRTPPTNVDCMFKLLDEGMHYLARASCYVVGMRKDGECFAIVAPNRLVQCQS